MPRCFLHAHAMPTVWHTRAPQHTGLLPPPCTDTAVSRRRSRWTCRAASRVDDQDTSSHHTRPTAMQSVAGTHVEQGEQQPVDHTTSEQQQDADTVQESYNPDGTDPNTELEESLHVVAANTRIRTAEYVSSCVTVSDCPAPQYPEIAVIGRSNVGKSSLINMLTNNRRLAHVSKEPGKTRCINHFLINGSWYLVDLPGYGFARTGFSMRDAFDKFTRQYFQTRPSLALVYLLVDSSIAPQRIDLEYAQWLWEHKVPFGLVFTKADKRKKHQPPCRENVASFKQLLVEEYGVQQLPPIVITSSETGMGRTPLLHLTCAIRDALLATGKLDQAMLDWQRKQLSKTDAESDAGQGQERTLAGQQGSGKGAGKGGKNKNKPGKTKGSRNRARVLPGEDIPLPKWTVRAKDVSVAEAGKPAAPQTDGAAAV